MIATAVIAGPGTGYVFASRRKEPTMGLEDKLSNKSEDAKGKAKEAVGGATGDDELKNQGKADQAKSDIKDAGEKIKDAFKH